MRRMRVALFAGALATIGLGVSTSASAAVCPSGYGCAYSSTNYAGTPGKVFYSNDNLTGYYQFANAKSASNSGNNCDVVFYSGTNAGGSPLTIKRGYGLASLSGTAWYNHIYSNRWAC